MSALSRFMSLIEHAGNTLATLRLTPGVVSRGDAHVDDPVHPLRSGQVTVRISKGVGMPGGLPDVIGVAVRFPAHPAGFDARSRDLLLIGPGHRFGGVVLATPTNRWEGVELTAPGTVDHDGRTWRFTAELALPATGGRLSTPALARALSEGGGSLLLYGHADGTPGRRLGRVDFGAPRPTLRDPPPTGHVPGMLNEASRSSS